MSDKKIEKERYDLRADAYLSANVDTCLVDDYLSTIPVDMRSPYIFFKKIVSCYLDETKTILEIGSGTGAITNWLVQSGAAVTASDISPRSVEFLNRIYRCKENFKALEADMEALPFQSQSFDVVVSAGVLSYGGHEITRDEIFRVLKPGGTYICVDSLNHNPIFKINRFIHYMRGNRTKSTLLRMPTLSLLESYEEKFGLAELRFFGSLSWLFPLLRKSVGYGRTARIGDWCDQYLNIRRSAFKFVMVVTKQYGNK